MNIKGLMYFTGIIALIGMLSVLPRLGLTSSEKQIGGNMSFIWFSIQYTIFRFELWYLCLHYCILIYIDDHE